MSESKLFLWATIIYCLSLVGCVFALLYVGCKDILFAPIIVSYRMLVTVPLAVALSSVALIAFDLVTPGDWLHHLTSEEVNVGTKIGVGLVVSSLILGIFWVSVQG